MPLVSDQIRLNAQAFPDEVAYRVVDGPGMTHAEWDGQASRVARGLIERGIEPQERVALLFEPDDALHHLQAYMGVHKAGGACVPVNVRLSPGEIQRIFDHCEPSAVLASQGLADWIRDVVEQVPSIHTFATTGDGTGVDLSWQEFLSDNDDDVQAPIDETDIADILYTSGTTGRPKGVVARHNRATQMDVGRPDTIAGLGWLHASPLFTFAGISLTTVPLRLGFTGMYMSHFDAGRWLQVVEEEPVALAFIVPAMAELIVAHEDFEKRDLSSLMMLTTGSAPISPSTLLTLQQRLPHATISNAYSMTEAGQAYTVMPKGELEKRPGAVGQPVPPLEVRIVDEYGAPLPAGEIGEVVMRNPGKEREYFRDEEASARTWKDGWLYSEDLGYLDEDGFLYITGRKKDVIIRGGNNIYAVDVENALYEHPRVLQAAVVGLPHPVLGEDVGAYLVPVAGEELSLEEVQTFCEEHLADYKRPRHVRIVEELPRNAMGKVLKRQLIEEFAAEHV